MGVCHHLWISIQHVENILNSIATALIYLKEQSRFKNIFTHVCIYSISHRMKHQVVFIRIISIPKYINQCWQDTISIETL